MDCFAFISLVTLWALQVHGVYHELSMKEFKAPITVRNITFGYSVAYLKRSNQLIIGAPKADKVGKIYKCELSSSLCSEITTSIREGPTDFWLGATVATGKDFTVACAPRFIERREKLGTFGRCYVKKFDDLVVSEMLTLNDTDKEVLKPYEKCMDSFGWSLNVDPANSIIVGGPAMYTGRAELYTNMTSYPILIRGDKWRSEYTFGYSVTSGAFLQAHETIYAISSPYGLKGQGKVILTDGFKGHFLEPPNQYKPPVGSLLGASMCSAKLRGPGQREALLIGAPTYARNPQFNIGIVYVYLFNLEKKMVLHERTILGTVPGGQFGSAVISLGDLNGDEKDEVAVSAPYENNGRGAVYIYSAAEILSDKSPVKLSWLQKINPEGYHTIGLSLAPVNDDRSACNGLAIGAPDSDKVLYLNCIPQVKVTVWNLADIKTPSYTTARRNDTFFVYNSCVTVLYPSRPSPIKADILINIKLDHHTARIANSDQEKSKNFTISLAKLNLYCEPIELLIPQEAGYEPSVQYTVTAAQVNGPLTMRYPDPSHAVISDLSVLTLTDTLWVADCKGDKECIPELSFQITTSLGSRKEYLIGSSDSVDVAVSVLNKGDVAYRSCLVVNMTGVRLRSRPPACSRLDGHHSVIVCTPQQPIRTQWNTSTIELDTKSLTSAIEEITIQSTIYDNCETKSDGRTKSSYIKLVTDPAGIFMRSLKEDNLYLTQTELEETGRQVSHVYSIYNNGDTFWVNLICDIVFHKETYFKDLTVTVDSKEIYKCEDITTNADAQYVTRCVVSQLKRNQKFQVIMSIKINTGILNADILNKQNTTLASTLKLTYGKHQMEQSIQNTLKMKEGVVPLWVIIAAALVGFLIMIILVIALYECGFLRRKNKAKLKSLKRNVHRQSIRRSMAVRNSSRIEGVAKEAEDTETLLEEVPLDKSPPRLYPEEDLPDIRPLPIDINFGIPPPFEFNDGKKKELIILGLQKNIGGTPRKVPPPPPPKPARPSTSSSEIKF